MNKDNLIKLANYLLSSVPQEEFDMYDFRSPCGTMGCAIGHGPESGIPKFPGETWAEYCVRAFGVTRGHSWDWCFDGEWRYHDNTPQGAAVRILYLVEHGAPPADWDRFGAGEGSCL